MKKTINLLGEEIPLKEAPPGPYRYEAKVPLSTFEVGGQSMRDDTSHTTKHFSSEAPMDRDAIDPMEAALENLLDHYLQLANSGDAGNWDPEEEPVVIEARRALSEGGKKLPPLGAMDEATCDA